MAKVNVGFADTFLTSFANLPKKIQGKVTEFLTKFRANPKGNGINYEKLHRGTDSRICSVRIDQAYRGIVARDEESDTYMLLWVDHHDEAYRWAERKAFSVNKYTGALQLYTVQDVTSDYSPKSEGIFSKISTSKLLRLGVPEDQINFVKTIGTKEDFLSLEESFAKDTFENLSWIADDIPVDEVLEMVEEEQRNAEHSTSLQDALKNPITLKSFVVLEGETELKRILAEPLEFWRIFLHPTQRKIVKKDFNGPAKVTGTAGTGKTVVAMHRANELAKKCSENDRILFTTFTANLAEDIKDNLKKICDRKELRRIEVMHLDGWVSKYLSENGYQSKIIYGKEEQALWKDALDYVNNGLDFPVDFYMEEYQRVAVAQNAITKQTYIRAPRIGRGTPLDHKKRLLIWQVFEEYQNLMKEKGVRDANTAMLECAQIVSKLPEDSKYKHIIVDEGQDLSSNAYRLIRALAGEEHKNDIFIVGDSHQRIYKNYSRLSKCGIKVVGRSSILRINYRTTEETRKYAFALLNGISFDDLDEGKELDDKCQSLTHGSNPEIHEFDKRDSEIEFLVRNIKALNEANVPLKDICVTVRTGNLVEEYEAALSEAGIECYKITRENKDNRKLEALRIATMHRVKGLEFEYVFVAAVNEGVVPLRVAMNTSEPVARKEAELSEKCLLYVALTRARKAAYITSYGKKSLFLK